MKPIKVERLSRQVAEGRLRQLGAQRRPEYDSVTGAYVIYWLPAYSLWAKLVWEGADARIEYYRSCPCS